MRPIPVRISPFFWITAALIGFLFSGTWTGTIIWMGIVFISVLFHELGHAIVSQLFGQKPRIQLVAFGGLTFPEGKKIKPWQEFLVVLAGPCFGLLLYLGATYLLEINVIFASKGAQYLRAIAWINLFWSVVNLLPIMPMDGGQLVRIVLEKIFGIKGLKFALLASVIIGSILALTLISTGYFLFGVLFFLFIFQNVEAYRQSKFLAESDRDETLKSEFEEAEECLEHGDEKKAEILLDDVQKKTKEGVLHALSGQVLSELAYKAGDFEKAYQLLLPLQDMISPVHLQVLHHSAFEMGDYGTVLSLGAKLFQQEERADVALRTALAAGYLKDLPAAIGWITATISCGHQPIDLFLKHKAFDAFRQEQSFKDLA